MLKHSNSGALLFYIGHDVLYLKVVQTGETRPLSAVFGERGDFLRILAIDPGNTSGFCLFKEPKEFISFYVEEDLEQIYREIKEREPEIVVFENFVLYPAFARHLVWNDMYTSQVIGVIKLTCLLLDIPYVMQSASNKDYVQYPKDHQFRSEHEKDAYGHAWYYYMKRKGI